MIEANDLMRLVNEIAANEAYAEPENFLEENEISEEAISFMFEMLCKAAVRAVEEGVTDEESVVPSLVGTAFQLGWEAHKQYGRPATPTP